MTSPCVTPWRAPRVQPLQADVLSEGHPKVDHPKEHGQEQGKYEGKFNSCGSTLLIVPCPSVDVLLPGT